MMRAYFMSCVMRSVLSIAIAPALSFPCCSVSPISPPPFRESPLLTQKNIPHQSKFCCVIRKYRRTLEELFVNKTTLFFAILFLHRVINQIFNLLITLLITFFCFDDKIARLFHAFFVNLRCIGWETRRMRKT